MATKVNPKAIVVAPEEDDARVQIVLFGKAAVRAQKLKDRTEAASMVEVTKSALRFYEMLLDETESGGKFMIERKDGTVVSVMVLS